MDERKILAAIEQGVNDIVGAIETAIVAIAVGRYEVASAIEACKGDVKEAIDDAVSSLAADIPRTLKRERLQKRIALAVESNAAAPKKATKARRAKKARRR